MPTQYETGHAKNAANLQKLIKQVTVYSNYNPPVDNLKVDNLQTLYTSALNKLDEVEEKRNANKNAIHNRQVTFKNLKSTCTRIINHLEILGLTEGTLEQAKSLNRLIQGSKKNKPKSTNENEKTTPSKETEGTTVSTSRQSYTQQADNFGILLQLVTTISSYNPNLDELKLTNLTTYQASLMNSTQAVDQTEAELNAKLIERNNLFYANGTGLYTIAQNTKKYVKSIYGATSPEYTNVSKIKFYNRKL